MCIILPTHTIENKIEKINGFYLHYIYTNIGITVLKI